MKIEASSRGHPALDKFVDKLLRLNENNLLPTIVCPEFTGDIRKLLGNEHVFQPDWEDHDR